jgi:acyl carrier protein phosphodiesterase
MAETSPARSGQEIKRMADVFRVKRNLLFRPHTLILNRTNPNGAFSFRSPLKLNSFLSGQRRAHYSDGVNYLAHLHLSGKDPNLIIGNFIGDGIRGDRFLDYPSAIQKGILLHRKIDQYTDTHPVVLQSKIRLRPLFHKYAPVIVDVFHDYFLARNWEQYHDENLRTFVDRMYDLLDENQAQFPERSSRFLHYAMEKDLFYAYKTVEGIDLAFRGLAHRTRFPSGMEKAAEELQRHQAKYESEFKEFFPDLMENVRTVV